MQRRQGCRPRTPWWRRAALALCVAATLPGAVRLSAQEECRAENPIANNWTTGSVGTIDLIGNSVLALGTVILLTLAALTLQRATFDGRVDRGVSAEPDAASVPDRR